MHIERLVNSSTIISVFSGLVLVFFSLSLVLNEWKVGAAVHEGQLRVIHVGLQNAVLEPTQVGAPEETVVLRELCEMNLDDMPDNVRAISLPSLSVPVFETPQAVWCALADEGENAGKLLMAAWAPALVVSIWSSMRTLQHLCPQVSPLLDRIEGLGMRERVIDVSVTAVWSVYWLLILVAVMMYAVRIPNSFGIGPSLFGQSFELARCCVLQSTLLAVILLGRALKLWSTQSVKDFVAEVRESRMLKFILYLLFGVQIVLYLIASLTYVQLSAVTCFMGLSYLATKSLHMLWGYVFFTLVSMPMDLFVLVAAPWHRLNFVGLVAYSSLTVIAVLKAVVLVGMLALHLKFNFRLNFRSDRPQRLDDDNEFEA